LQASPQFYDSQDFFSIPKVELLAKKQRIRLDGSAIRSRSTSVSELELARNHACKPSSVRDTTLDPKL
jgi:hypothetical protein